MRRLILCAIFATILSPVEARPRTFALTCAEAAGLVRSTGAAVLQTGPRNYDRYLASRMACSPNEDAVPKFAPTLDDPKCHIGYLCEERARILNWWSP